MMNIEGRNLKKESGIRTSLNGTNNMSAGYVVDLIGYLYAGWVVYKPTRLHLEGSSCTNVHAPLSCQISFNARQSVDCSQDPETRNSKLT